MKLKIAVLQLNPRIGSVGANIERANSILAAHGFLDLPVPTTGSPAEPKKPSRPLDILVLPELAFTGYNFKSKSEIAPYLEPTTAGISTQWAQKTAKRLHCHTLVGYPETTGGSTPKTYNSAVMVDPTGLIAFNYRKTFLYSTDEIWGCSEPPENNYLDGNAFPLTGTITVEKSSSSTSSSTNDTTTNRTAGETTDTLRMRTQVGICMDLNPYKFESPFTDYEFATAALKNKATLVLCPTAWLHPSSPDIMTSRLSEDSGSELESDSGSELESEDKVPITEEYKRQRLVQVLADQETSKKTPEFQTVNYWLMRLKPLLERREGVGKLAIAICNRSGVEDLTMYAGSSSVFTFNRVTKQTAAHDVDDIAMGYHGSLGQAEEGLLYSEIDV